LATFATIGNPSYQWDSIQFFFAIWHMSNGYNVQNSRPDWRLEQVRYQAVNGFKMEQLLILLNWKS